jgi:hypothetical protein
MNVAHGFAVQALAVNDDDAHPPRLSLGLERHDPQLAAAALRMLTAAIIPRPRLRIRVSRQSGHRTDVGPSVEQVTDEGSPEIMRREPQHSSLRRPPPQDLEHALRRHPPCDHATGLVDRPE